MRVVVASLEKVGLLLLLLLLWPVVLFPRFYRYSRTGMFFSCRPLNESNQQSTRRHSLFINLDIEMSHLEVTEILNNPAGA